jgi:photosystem II stability/assembly factor-like uncharacterized protein
VGFFNGFSFWNREAGALVGDPVEGRIFVLITEDGGESWRRLEGEGIPEPREGEYGFAASGTNIATFGANGIAIVSGGTAARVFLSRDRGRSWEVVETPMAFGSPSTGIFSIAFNDRGEAMAVGGDYQNDQDTRGTVAYSRDGGRSWTLSQEPNDVGFRSGVAWRDHPELPLWVAVGTSGSSYSSDGGRSWVTFDSLAYNAVAFAGGVGWTAGPQGRVARMVIR